MNLQIRVVTHAIPKTIGIAVAAMVVLTIKQFVFITNGLFQRYPSTTMCAVDVSDILSAHPVVSLLRGAAWAGVSGLFPKTGSCNLQFEGREAAVKL